MRLWSRGYLCRPPAIGQRPEKDPFGLFGTARAWAFIDYSRRISKLAPWVVACTVIMYNVQQLVNGHATIFQPRVRAMASARSKSITWLSLVWWFLGMIVSPLGTLPEHVERLTGIKPVIAGLQPICRGWAYSGFLGTTCGGIRAGNSEIPFLLFPEFDTTYTKRRRSAPVRAELIWTPVSQSASGNNP